MNTSRESHQPCAFHLQGISVSDDSTVIYNMWTREMPNLCLQRQLFQEEETEVELAKKGFQAWKPKEFCLNLACV